MENSPKNTHYFIQQSEPPSELMQLVLQATEMELQQIITAIMHRYDELFPDWEVTYLALPNDPVQREIAIESTMQFLRKYHK